MGGQGGAFVGDFDPFFSSRKGGSWEDIFRSPVTVCPFQAGPERPTLSMSMYILTQVLGMLRKSPQGSWRGAEGLVR
jgi:hypothetical protein